MKTLYKIFVSSVFAFLTMHSCGQDTLVYPYPAALLPNAGAANVTAAECYFDSDPGFGNGTSIPLSAGGNVSVSNFTIAIDTLSAGVHRLFIRVENVNGSWSLCNATTLFIIPQGVLLPANTGPADILAAEYYFDSDPGFGNGTGITITAGSNVSFNNIVIPLGILAQGVHRLYVRVKNTLGVWSLTDVANLFVIPQAALFPANAEVTGITATEYFIDSDPGLGNGTSIPVEAGNNVSAENIIVPIDALSQGVHHIYVRVKNTAGSWSNTNAALFYVVPVSFTMPPNAAAGNITALEYFFDSDPGFGNGTMIAVPPATDLSNYAITADISGLQQDTLHTLYVRALDGWSQTTTTTFMIGSPLPLQWLSFTGKLQPDNKVLLQWRVAGDNKAGYFQVERGTDGKHFMTIARISTVDIEDSSSGYRYWDTYPLQGNNYYRVRQIAADGRVLYSPVILINTMGAASDEFYVINNPARNKLRVHIGESTGKARLQIIDMNGSIMKQVPVTTDGIREVDISQMTTGTYIIRYVSPGKVVTKRFVIE